MIRDTEVIYEGRITRYELKTIELPNKKIKKYEFVDHKPAVAVIALTADDCMIFVEQYRLGVDRKILEIPAGLVDPGEVMLDSAKRELEEETATGAKSWRELRSFYTAPGFTNSYNKIFEARDLYPVKNPLPQDDDEFLKVVQLTFAEAEAAYERGDICDMKTIWALDYWRTLQETREH